MTKRECSPQNGHLHGFQHLPRSSAFQGFSCTSTLLVHSPAQHPARFSALPRNPNLTQSLPPRQRITLVVRSDSSGTTEIFKKALAMEGPATTVCPMPTHVWPLCRETAEGRLARKPETFCVVGGRSPPPHPGGGGSPPTPQSFLYIRWFQLSLETFLRCRRS